MRQLSFGPKGHAGAISQEVQYGFGAAGDGNEIPTVPAGSGDTENVTSTVLYDDAAIAELYYMIEEEKLAGDIYEAFYDLYGLKIFDQIATSEDRHFDALISQAENIGLDVDVFLLEPAGTFLNDELQEMYDTLLASGSVSVTDALEVGLAIETKDMTDIAEAIEEVEGTPLAETYDHLLTGSGYHLDAFASLLA
ncbi:DUF2202 domain-containing protein [Salipiger sp. P9]|uniref:DUF2202 domain-containing protein n=1 Tax=Salipiger pentaromativorans TaxID=2943193 RepID=UPI0021588712|nr:DUF2202 domain-containing protein [Salipiger pentaromativorans]MCR8548024.1 DUF2202 domain-containing protein [Salipiger pentaromativorans]